MSSDATSVLLTEVDDGAAFTTFVVGGEVLIVGVSAGVTNTSAAAAAGIEDCAAASETEEDFSPDADTSGVAVITLVFVTDEFGSVSTGAARITSESAPGDNTSSDVLLPF